MFTRFRTLVLSASLVFSSLSFARGFERIPGEYHRFGLFYLEALLTFRNLSFTQNTLQQIWNRLLGIESSQGTSSSEIEIVESESSNTPQLLELATQNLNSDLDDFADNILEEDRDEGLSLADDLLLQEYFRTEFEIRSNEVDPRNIRFKLSRDELNQLERMFGLRLYANYQNEISVNLSNTMIHILLMIVRGQSVQDFLKHLLSKNRREFHRIREEAKLYKYSRLQEEFQNFDNLSIIKRKMRHNILHSEEFRKELIFVYPFLMKDEGEFFKFLLDFIPDEIASDENQLHALREIVAQFNEYPDGHFPLGQLQEFNEELLNKLREKIQMPMKKQKRSYHLTFSNHKEDKVDKLELYSDADIADAITFFQGQGMKKLKLSELKHYPSHVERAKTFSQMTKETNALTSWIKNSVKIDDRDRKIARLKRWIGICKELMLRRNYHGAFHVFLVLKDNVDFIKQNQAPKRRRSRVGSLMEIKIPPQQTMDSPETPRKSMNIPDSSSQSSGSSSRSKGSPRLMLNLTPRVSGSSSQPLNEATTNSPRSPRQKSFEKDKAPEEGNFLQKVLPNFHHPRSNTEPNIHPVYFTNEELKFVNDNMETFSILNNLIKFRKHLDGELFNEFGELRVVSIIPPLFLWTKDVVAINFDLLEENVGERLDKLKSYMMLYHNIQKNYKLEPAHYSLIHFLKGLDEDGVSTKGQDPFKSPRDSNPDA